MAVRLVPMLLALILSACSGGAPDLMKADPPGGAAREPDADTTRPAPRPASGVPGAGAQTAEALDATTPAERAAAAAPGAAGRELGQVIGALGDARQAGFWLKTPLVTAEQPGRVVSVANGKSAKVTLIPDDGANQLSLAAMRVLEIPLTDLPELVVYAQ